MDTSGLKKFAQYARRSLLEQVESKLSLVLADESEARRESPKAIAELEAKLKELGREQLIDQVAYTWFNRFCALRFMDVNQYNRIMVISPSVGQVQPEILAEAKAGHIDENTVSASVREKVFGLLGGSIASRDGQAEAFRLLIVAVCNELHKVMPYMFESINSYTELLMPEDLFSENSILSYARKAMTPEACETVETIGWLYQFYISEKKDDVFAALKKGKKITPENIPAATQLFTPHWIVRYLVENSLGRLWMLNHPESKLFQNMKDRGEDFYYIEPEEPETDFLQISSPEEIKICDPACGSGHMLTYAFDLLYAIYEELGYQVSDIPRLILTHNLFGVEIDQRAGSLAAFALTMKARAKYRRFLSKGKVVQPNICVLENVKIDPEDLSAYMDKVGHDLFTDGLQGVLNQWDEADNFGSLICPLVTDVSEVLELLRERQMGADLFLADVHQKVLRGFEQADYLSPKYHVVVANPPFMGRRNQATRLREFLTKHFKGFEKNLFSAFIKRARSLSLPDGLLANATPFVWLTISSYENLRREILDEMTVLSLVKPSYTAFFEVATVQFVAFVLSNRKHDVRAKYFDLGYLGSAQKQPKRLHSLIESPTSDGVFVRAADDFRALPGTPLAFSVSKNLRKTFIQGKSLEEVVPIKQGLATTDNATFLRNWWEISFDRIGFGIANGAAAKASKIKWFPYNKGGDFRKWYGNNQAVVNWKNDGEAIKKSIVDKYPYLNGNPGFVAKNTEFYFRPSITWSLISSYSFGARVCKKGFVFDVGGSSAFPNEEERHLVTGLLCSKLSTIYLQALNPTANMQVGNIASIPFMEQQLNEARPRIKEIVTAAVEIATRDWDSQETSWDFGMSTLFEEGVVDEKIRVALDNIVSWSQSNVSRLKELEEKNNDAFISSYGLSEELEPTVDISHITLNCNIDFRYGGEKSASERISLLLADTMREYISYAVGCMFGRYSLDKPGLILGNQGETAEDYRKLVPAPTFAPDKDNVIPLLDGDWFEDDIHERFKEFLKLSFGNENFDENLTFLENALYPENLTGKKRKTIRDYFLKEFYSHHIKLYKKRPIYWLFSSHKGTFSALIYMHRYRTDTVSVVLNDYLREFHAKLEARKDSFVQVEVSATASATDKKNAINQIRKIDQVLVEIKDYEHEILYPLAAKKIEIDLDDGVKHNYPLFGKALKKIPGLS